MKKLTNFSKNDLITNILRSVSLRTVLYFRPYGLGFLPDGRLLAIDQGVDDRRADFWDLGRPSCRQIRLARDAIRQNAPIPSKDGMRFVLFML